MLIKRSFHICNLRLLVRCALYGIDEKDRCPNWKDGVYKPCQVESESESKKETTTSTDKGFSKETNSESPDKICVNWYLWGRYVLTCEGRYDRD